MEGFFKGKNILDWVDKLSDKDFVIIEEALPTEQLNELLNCFEERRKEDKFRKAAIGVSGQKQIDRSIRGDNIFWLDKNSEDVRIKNFFVMMDYVQDNLNRYCFLSLSDYEFHFAHYPPGTFYKRHLDQFQGRNNRLISIVFYLNETWEKSYGGQLRLFFEKDKIDIDPLFGRLVMFKSAVLEHEVLTTFKDRYSITGWMLYRPIGLEIIDL